ncbi:MAG: uroporphyrinogen-III synthase [Candidatus Eremiobacteraeota bacterium]|nr:uroporphyrinogen-III synthase [Candidatus Eremiobacteraeota bacterium]MBV8366410.1 uroporphyrinogen-III synthase [Candidatus Eremiobacteraeota bacterium]
MSAPLAGVRVLLTHPARTSDQLEPLLRADGADVVCAPLIEITAAPDAAALQTAVDAADDADWVVFSSVNGVEAFARMRDAPLRPGTFIAAVGRATASAVDVKLGRPADLVPSRPDAEGLAEELVGRAHERARIAVFVALDAGPALVQRLRTAGLRVDAAVAYATRAVAHRDLARSVAGADIIVLTSGSGARALAEGLALEPGLEALAGKAVVCIGPVTAAAASGAGIAVTAVACDPSPHALREAIRSCARR